MENHKIKVMQRDLWTVKLLRIGGGFFVFTTLIATFLKSSEPTIILTSLLSLLLVISFGINLAGFVIGFSDRKKNYRLATIGIIGNFVFILGNSVVLYLLGLN